MASKGNVQVAYFSVGDPTSHASIWRLWSPRRKGDVYLGPRFQSGYFKLSLHESGARHLRRAGADVRDHDRGDFSFQWNADRGRPGVEVAWRILTPSTEVREARMHPRFKSRVRWLPPGAANAAEDLSLVLSFGLIFPEGRFPHEHVPGMSCLLRWRLGNGETLFLLHRRADITAEHHAWFAQERAEVRTPADWGVPDGSRHDFRLWIVKDLPEFRGCFDLAWDPPSSRADAP